MMRPVKKLLIPGRAISRRANNDDDDDDDDETLINIDY